MVGLRLDVPAMSSFALDWVRLTGDPAEHDCANGLDDDADDLVDCDDPDCATDAACI